MPSNAPKITSIEISGSTASTDSTRARLLRSVTSVTHALKAASFAVEPNSVITQSSTMTITAATVTALAAGKSAWAFSTVTKPKAAVDRPQSRYPAQRNALRLPTRSDHAPTSSVVTVATAALHATMAAMYEGSVEIVLYKNTLKYIFSIVHAN